MTDYLKQYPPDSPETYHPDCLRWSPLDADALAGLTADIQAHGLHEPIAVHDGRIADGRHRYLACIAAGVTPRFDALPADMDVAAYIRSRNAHRRHADKGELAFLAALASLDSRQGRQRKRCKNAPLTVQAAALAYGVSVRYVKQQRSAILAHPDLAARLRQGGPADLPYAAWKAEMDRRAELRAWLQTNEPARRAWVRQWEREPDPESAVSRHALTFEHSPFGNALYLDRRLTMPWAWRKPPADIVRDDLIDRTYWNEIAAGGVEVDAHGMPSGFGPALRQAIADKHDPRVAKDADGMPPSWRTVEAMLASVERPILRSAP